MRNLSLSIFVFTLVFNLLSCKPSHYFEIKNSSTPINDSYSNNTQVDSLIQPYKTKLDAEMNEVLVVSTEEFPKEKGKSETKLGNLVADLSLEIAQNLYKPSDRHKIDFCLLNFGGLRTSLPKGAITRGKIFELMPFENELVVVTINQSSFDSLVDYVKNVGGQPVSGIKFNFLTPKTSVNFKYRKNNKSLNETYKVLTSDYLANGGDNMSFFLNPINIESIDIKLRDAIIQYCIAQNKKGKQLSNKLDGRIIFE